EVTWAERLGFPAGKIVIMFHADDMGMCEETNDATIKLFENNKIQSASAMPPCPGFKDAIEWAKNNPDADVGLHLSFTNAMKFPNWGTVANPKEVPGLLNTAGYMWKTVEQVAENATAEEVEKELRAQIEKSLALGFQPKHIDSHMGTLYSSTEYTEVYIKLSEEYGIPISNLSIRYGLTDKQKELIQHYSMPKFDYSLSIPWEFGDTYEEMREKLIRMIESLKPGINYIAVHPQVKSNRNEKLTKIWQYRVWQTDLLFDPLVTEVLEKDDIMYTNWKDIMQRYERHKKSS
ncbi:polysaccharide deacetylase family protein, partial [Bacteroidota bacterium]